MDDGLTSFARAVSAALDRLGTGLLGRPQEFTGAVADLHDPDSPEMAVLYVHCTDELMRPYADAARERAADALGQAARRGELWLHDVRRVDAGDARSVAWGIARGVAAHLGVALPGCAGGPGGGASGEAAERARAVLSDAAVTEADVAAALAALRALPEGAQRSALEAALEGRLAKLAEEREKAEVARRSEEERLRREAEGREQEAERKRREEQARLVKEQEAERKAAEETAQQDATRTEDERRENDSKPGRRWLGVALAVIACIVVPAALFAYSHSGTHKKDSPVPTAVVAEDDAESNEVSVSGVGVREGVSEYSWGELKELSAAISKAKSDEHGLKIAKEYNLVDSDGKLRGDTKAVKLTDGTKTSVRILGFRHDELADGGRAGITFEFADAPVKHSMNADNTNEGGWEKSEMRAWLNSDFFALVPDDLQSHISVASKRTNNVGGEAGDDASVVSTTDDKLWLLSLREVFTGELRVDIHIGPEGKDTGWHGSPGMCISDDHWEERVVPDAIYESEGTQYQLYADQGVTMSDYDFCEKEENDWGPAWCWWLRSPIVFHTYGGFHRIGEASGCSDYYAYENNGVSPGFCF